MTDTPPNSKSRFSGNRDPGRLARQETSPLHVAATTLLLLIVLTSGASAQANTPTVEDLNRIARNHIGAQTQLSGFNLFFTTESATFDASGPVLIVTITGTYLDMRAYNEATNSGDIDLPLRIQYRIDIRGLDRDLGITSADASEIIELTCDKAEDCIELSVRRGSSPMPPPPGIIKGLLPGFGRTKDAALADRTATLLENLCRIADAMRARHNHGPTCG